MILVKFDIIVDHLSIEFGSRPEAIENIFIVRKVMEECIEHKCRIAMLFEVVLIFGEDV